MQLTKLLEKKSKRNCSQLVEAIDKEMPILILLKLLVQDLLIYLYKNAMTSIIKEVIDFQDDYGKSNYGQGIKYNVEFVSANPTGDLHLGHAKGAAVGDSICRIMSAAGYDVTREYYINDAGNQIENLALSLYARYNKLLV